MTAPTKPSRLLRGLVIGGVLGAVAMSLTALYGDAQAIAQIGLVYPWQFFGAACALTAGNYVLRFARWELYLRELSIRIPMRQSGLIFLAGFSMSITPAKMGELLKSWLLKRRFGTPVSHSAPVVIVERIGDVAALLFLTAIGAQRFEVGIMLVPVCIAGLLCLLMLSQRSVGLQLLWWLKSSAFGLRIASRVEPLLHAYWKLGSARVISLGFALSVLGWALEVTAFMLICSGVQLEFGFLRSCFVFSSSTLGGALSMLPGGLGATEFGFTALLQDLGASARLASFCTILTRLATLWLAVALGLVALAVCLKQSPALTVFQPGQASRTEESVAEPAT